MAGIVPLGVGRIPLGTAPVDIRLSASRGHLFSLMRGASFYGSAAGGFTGVPAMPRIQAFAAPASANRDVEQVQRYADAPGLLRQQLARQFPARARTS